ncbi:MAG: hypothetical protein LBU74_04610 [Methanobacteriaceae archaeon]|nr:hypothetical protein [Candidatus Methanorudis spinitermitis]
MNIKKALILILFAIAIVGIIAPVNAKLNCETWSHSNKIINGKTKMTLGIASNIGSTAKNWDSPKYITQRKAELNKVNKITVTIKGYKTIIFKKPTKGWKLSGITDDSLYKSFSVKNNPNNKFCIIKCYDKKGKLIKQQKGKVQFNPYHQRL